MIEDALYSIITANADVTAIIGDRIYPDKLPQKPTLPTLVYYNVGGTPQGQHSGAATLEFTRFQIDAYAKTSRSAKLLLDAVRQAVESYRGLVGGVRIDTISIIEHAVGDYDDVPDDYRRTTEIGVWHTL